MDCDIQAALSLKALMLEYTKALAGPIATVVAATAAAYYAKRQVDLAIANLGVTQDKFKRELYDKRYKIYEYTKILLDNARSVNINDIEYDLVISLEQKLNERRFLFSGNICEFIDAVVKLTKNACRYKSNLNELCKSYNYKPCIYAAGNKKFAVKHVLENIGCHRAVERVPEDKRKEMIEFISDIESVVSNLIDTRNEAIDMHAKIEKVFETSLGYSTVR